MKTTSKADRPRSILSPLQDAANSLTLGGTASSALAIVAAVAGDIHLSMILALFAVTLDWIDGVVARRSHNRASGAGEVGPFLDCSTDFLSNSLAPATIVLSLNGIGAWQAIAFTVIVLCGVIRMSYHNAFGFTADGRVQGLPLAHNIPLLAVLTPLYPTIIGKEFGAVFALVTVVLSILNVSSFYFPRGRDDIVPHMMIAFLLLIGVNLLVVLLG
ncbi:CDP-alcohol phosphatidyltransferase family protein [Sinorhizobium meliloti]|uniref:CDP-alcohol phosphatidyltransferase family protein n=1 Tax=Rhizobium meliloti TaxID=382 RepID=UPI000FD974E8|nr:CDP-alcohol phosphatidyltransferase family protein [Sinorhizobium meliloti]RVP19091.1 hypothetical protein CN080_26810 [Sinorhizobium meliloti]